MRLFTTARFFRNALFPLACVLVLSPFVLASCAAVRDTPAKRFSDILHRYPGTEEPLKVRSLAKGMAEAKALGSLWREAIIMVHPAYSLFFRDTDRSTYTEAKYGLLKYQLDSEAQFINEAAKAGKFLILVLPGNYLKESIAPQSYTAYLNTTTEGGPTVFYIYSETSSSGVLPPDAMVTLYQVLQEIKVERVLLGGGYIGRCQREFHSQLLNYVEKIDAYVVPEISAISPDDITDTEAADILASLGRSDYTPVRKFIEKRTRGEVQIMSIPPKHRL